MRKAQGSESNGQINRQMEKDERSRGRRRARAGQHSLRFFRSLLVTNLKSVTIKTGEVGSKMTPLCSN